MMTSEDIRQLLQRFYDGETTHTEEHSLREWFRTNDCPEDLQPDRQMVMALSESRFSVPVSGNRAPSPAALKVSA